MRNAIIIGTGVCVPEKVLTNDDLSHILGENINDFVETKVGILERHIAAENESAADLATAAAKNALADAGISALEIDLIVLATDTPEYLSPATSVVVQHRIGAKNAGTFDVNAACAGFVTAFDTAAKYIVADENYKNILVVGCYAMTKFLDWTDKKTATLFADGAGAVVLRAHDDAQDGRGMLASKLYADGSYAEFMGIFAGGSKMPVTAEILAENKWNKLRFANKYPPEVNIEGWQKIVREVLAKADLDLEDVSLFLWTQVNISTIKIVMEQMKIPFENADDFKFGTVGKPMPMCSVKIAADGEILVKSSMMFSGYYKEPEKTAAMFDENGWLKTGDLGDLDADGFLKITGRKKEIIVLSSGKNVAPALVENLVKENHLVSQCFVCGDGKSYCVALITLNRTEVEMFAEANEIKFVDFAELTRSREIFSLISATVDESNARLSSSEQIKRFAILDRDFSADEDEITPTLKLKRNVVSERFKENIKKLYER